MAMWQVHLVVSLLLLLCDKYYWLFVCSCDYVTSITGCLFDPLTMWQVLLAVCFLDWLCDKYFWLIVCYFCFVTDISCCLFVTLAMWQIFLSVLIILTILLHFVAWTMVSFYPDNAAELVPHMKYGQKCVGRLKGTCFFCIHCLFFPGFLIHVFFHFVVFVSICPFTSWLTLFCLVANTDCCQCNMLHFSFSVFCSIKWIVSMLFLCFSWYILFHFISFFLSLHVYVWPNK